MISIEEQLRTAQSKRRKAEEQLRTWLPNWSAYSSRAASEGLEAYAAVTRDDDALAPSEVKSKAGQWMQMVRAEAARMADWEDPPQLSEKVPMRAEDLKLMLRDVERMLGALICLPTGKEEEESHGRPLEEQPRSEPTTLEQFREENKRLTEELHAARRLGKREVAEKQQMISQLQTQMSELRCEIDEVHRRQLMGIDVEEMLEAEEREAMRKVSGGLAIAKPYSGEVGEGGSCHFERCCGCVCDVCGGCV